MSNITKVAFLSIATSEIVTREFESNDPDAHIRFICTYTNAPFFTILTRAQCLLDRQDEDRHAITQVREGIATIDRDFGHLLP